MSDIPPLPELQTNRLRSVIGTTQEFAHHMMIMLEALKGMVPDPDDDGIAAHDFVQIMMNHVGYHQDSVFREMKAIDSIGKGETA